MNGAPTGILAGEIVSNSLFQEHHVALTMVPAFGEMGLAFAFVLIDDIVGVGIDDLRDGCEGGKAWAILIPKGIEVAIRSPLGVVDDTRAILALMQRRPEQTWFAFQILGELYPELEQLLLVFRLHAKDVDERCD